MFLARKCLSRRTVLRGAGATIALPLLNAMVPAATAIAKTAAAPRVRMTFIYFPHGAVMDRWSPATAGMDFEIPEILAPLARFRDYMTIVSGTRNKPAESSTPHAITAGTWLNCVTPAQSQEPVAGISADQIAAQHISADTPFPSLEMSTEGGGGPCSPVYGCSYGGTISFRTPTQPLPMENRPRKVFAQMFGQGNSEAERKAIIHESGSILDMVMDHAATLRAELGAEDRVMLNDYLDSVREIERRIAKLETQDTSGLDLPTALPVGVPENFDEHLRIMFQLMALAYQANLTRVTSFMMAKEASMRTYRNIGISEAFHPLSHHQNLPEKLDKLAQVQTYHSKVFGEFLQRLADMPDGDGSMLDHAIVLFGSNMSNSNMHNNDPLPAVIFGRAGGRIKGGQHLHYPQDTPLANLLLTLLDRAGIPLEQFGDSTGLMSEI